MFRLAVCVTEPISAAEAPDSVVTQFIADAAETIAIETGLVIDPTNCTTQEAVAIPNLAAIYCVTRVTGCSASELNFKVGGCPFLQLCDCILSL